MGATYDSEREVPAAEAERLRSEIQAFIQQYQIIPSFLMTFRKDGRPIMRPVSTFVEGWTVQTITQDLHPKTEHIRRNPVVAYLWTGEPDSRGVAWAPKNVFLQGTAELIDDPAEVEAFFARRKAKTGHGDAHPTDHDYQRILIKVTPQYLRAEGFYGASRPVVYRTFPD